MNKLKLPKIKAPQIIITVYLLVMLLFISKINISLYSIFNDSLIKFAMNFILVLSLIPMLKCGIGMNFGMAIGIIAGLIGMCISIEFKVGGIAGFTLALIITAIVGSIFGFLYSKILNRLKGKEDVIGMFCGYSFVFIMNIFWTVAPFKNRMMLYPIGGKGLRPKISLELFYDKILDNFLKIKVGNIVIPLGVLLFVGIVAIFVMLYFKTRAGKTMEVIAENEKFAELSGVNINKYRTIAIILSTIIAGIGICVYTQSYGFVQLYDSALSFSFPAVSAILIGGASRNDTKIFHAVIGTYLFQTTYLLSIPIANALLMPELAETLRMIVSNGIILYAFICEGGERGLWKKKKIKLFINKNIVPIIFVVMCLSMILVSNVGLDFLANELYRRIVRNTIMIIALLIPIMAGMGINFSVVIGALCTHFAAIIIVDRQIEGAMGIIAVFILAQVLSLICGNIIGYILNRAKGREMITSLVIGLLGTSIYTLIFLAGYGTIIKPHNPNIMLSTGIGIQTMIDLMPLKQVIVEHPYIPILFIIVAAAITKYLMGTQFGAKLKVIGDNMNNAYALGIDVDKMRRYAIVISTMLASAGQIMFVLNIGSINVYTGHLNVDVFACASILAGGATLNKASLKNVFLGVVLFHTMFIVSPMAGKVLFSNVAIGEYFRSFVAYSTIVISLIMNIHNEKQGVSD